MTVLDLGPLRASVELDDKAFTKKYGEVEKLANQLDKLDPTVRVDADTATAERKVEQVENRLERIVDADTVLVLGAGGGVGSATTQLAHAAGAAVLGVASAGKRDLVESCGGLWIESGDGFDARVAATAERCGAVTAVVDLVGGDVLERAVALTRAPERVVSVADPVRAENLGGSGITRCRTREVFEQVVALVERGVLMPRIARTFPLAEAGAALELVESGHAGGKIVVTFP